MKKNRKTTEGTETTTVVMEENSPALAEEQEHPSPQPSPPGGEREKAVVTTLARVATAECVIAGGVNRSELAITPEFQTDIAVRGVVSPLLVRALLNAELRADGLHYEIWAGARRWTAAVLAGVLEVPVAIYPAETPTTVMAELRLIENLQREDLTAFDEACQYREALEGTAYGVGRAGVEKLALQVGKSASHIYSRLRLLKLPKALHTAWVKGTVPQSIVELIATLPDDQDQLAALKHISTSEQEWDELTNKRTPVCMSVRDARAYIAHEFQSDLRKKIWRLDDADLYPEAGACTVCPFRGGHPDGAPGVDDPNACTRRSCYQKKRELALKQKVADATAAGKTVMPLKESEELLKYGHLLSGAPYREAKDKPYQDKKKRSYEQLLGKEAAASLAVHAVNPDSGDLVKLYKNTELNDALVKAGHDWAKPVNGAKPKPESAETKAQREADEARARQVERAVLEAVMKVVENPKLPERKHALLWAFVFAQWMELTGEPANEFFKRRNIARSSMDSIRKLSATSDLVLEVLRGECLENIIVGEYDGVDGTALRQLASLCGVDVKAIEAGVKTESGKAGKRESGKLKVKVPKPVEKPDPVKKKPARKGKGR